MTIPVSAIILTYNEEVNIRNCLESAKRFFEEIFIVDSLSTDKTLEIAREYTQKIVQNPWTTNAGQRQWALANLPLALDWVFFLDADERLTDNLKREMTEVLARETKNPDLGGYYVPRIFMFLGKPIRWGDCKGGLPELRLFNRHHITLGERGGFEVYASSLKVGALKEAMIHEDKKPLSAWIDRHNRYSELEALYLWRQRQGNLSSMGSVTSSSDQRLYWKQRFRQTVWNKLPIGFRPTLLFIFNFFFRLGFLDGITGFTYHFLHTFWYPLLIDAKFMEFKVASRAFNVRSRN